MDTSNRWCPEHSAPTCCQPPPLSLFQCPCTAAASPASQSAADRYSGCLCEKRTSYLYFESFVLFPMKLSLLGAEFTARIPSTLPTTQPTTIPLFLVRYYPNVLQKPLLMPSIFSKNSEKLLNPKSRYYKKCQQHKEHPFPLAFFRFI